MGKLLPAVTPFPLAEGGKCLNFDAVWWKVLFMCEVLISCYYSFISFKIFYGVLNEYCCHNSDVFLFTRCDISMRLVFLNKE